MHVYADHASTTPVDPKVMNAMQPFFSEHYSNPESVFYGRGYSVRQEVEKARDTIQKAIGSEKGKLVFTSGGTEANNLALFGYCKANKGKQIISTTIEHGSVLEPLKQLEKHGYEIILLDVDKTGRINTDALAAAISKKTALVSIGHANLETGTIQDMKKISKITRQENVPLHVDATYSFGRIPFNLKEIPSDLVSLTAHRMYGPKGIGALYIGPGIEVKPLIYGSGQEKGMRSGMINVPGVIGFGKAVELREKTMRSEAEKLRELEKSLFKLLEIPDSWLNGSKNHRIPGHVNISFKYVEGESIATLLDQQGIEVSTGSACSSPTLQASHVLLALGLKVEEVHGSVRFTLGKDNTKKQVDHITKHVPTIIKELRKISAWQPGEEYHEHLH